jgi:DNA replication protein DnaC
MKCLTCENEGFVILDDEIAIPCPDCSKKRLFNTRCNVANINERWREAQLPLSEHYNLEGYIGYDKDSKRKAQNINEILKTLMVELQSYGSLYFYGNTGRGKTYAAYAILMHWLREGHPVYSIHEEAFLEHAFGGPAEDNEDYDKFWFEDDRIKNVDILLIDEVGSTPMDSKGYKKNYMNEVIRSRFERKLNTLMTSNLTPEQLGEHYKRRVVSFMKEACVFLEFVSKVDYREAIQSSKMDKLEGYLE